jgi:hypothetical protein
MTAVLGANGISQLHNPGLMVVVVNELAFKLALGIRKIPMVEPPRGSQPNALKPKYSREENCARKGPLIWAWKCIN